jgi:hypothetical protein
MGAALGGGFSMLVRYSFFALVILACGCLQAGPCVTGTLFSYEALGATGCTVGNLTAFNFAFSVLGSSGGAVPVTDSQINVTPTFGNPGQLGQLNFASTGFNVSVNGSVQYLIAYTWDPHDDIQSMDDIMDPPSAVLGFANVTTVGCMGAAFTGAICPTSTATVMVFDNNGVRSASFDSFSGESRTPEPSTWLSCAAALALLAARLRRS